MGDIIRHDNCYELEKILNGSRIVWELQNETIISIVECDVSIDDMVVDIISLLENL